MSINILRPKLHSN